MSTAPGVTPVTIPATLTVAMPVFDERHVAVDVTFRDEPSENDAVAVIGAVAPTFGAVPLTDTPVVVTAGVGIVNRAEPLTFSKVAVMSTVPGAMPVTTPAAETVAIPVFDERHVAVAVTFRDEPSENDAEALIWLDAPTLGALPVTDTVVAVTTGAGIVILRVPVTLLCVAVISTVPGATPVTTPVLPTFAMPTFEVRQDATDVTFSVVPFDSDAVAVICVLAPTVGVDPITETLVTVGDGAVGAFFLLQVAEAMTSAMIAMAVADRRPRNRK